MHHAPNHVCTYTSLPRGDAHVRALQRHNRECIQLQGSVCVPCSDFGPQYFTALSDPAACVECSSSATASIVLLVSIGGVLLVAILIIARVGARHRSALRHISSFLVILSNAQTVSILGALDLKWPSSVHAIMRLIKLDLGLVQPECIAGASGGEALFWQYNLVVCLITTALLLGPRLRLALLQDGLTHFTGHGLLAQTTPVTAERREKEKVARYLCPPP